MTRVRAKRLGWNETTNVTATDELDPYDYPSDVVTGELREIKVDNGILHYTNYVVDGQVVDGDTVEEIPDEPARTAAVSLSTVDGEHVGAMIALVPSETDLDRLTLDKDDAEPREQLHLTLYFLGEAEMYEPGTNGEIAVALEQMVQDRGLEPVQGNAFGVNFWNPTSEYPAWVLAIGDVTNGESLVDVRASVADAIDLSGIPAQHYPWVPHVTIAYGTEPILEEMQARLGPITFDRIRVAFGNEHHDVELSNGRATLTAS